MMVIVPMVYLKHGFCVVMVYDWLKWTSTELVMKSTMYWASFEGKQRSNNKDSVTVHIPKNQYLNSDSVKELLNKIAEGEDL